MIRVLSILALILTLCVPVAQAEELPNPDGVLGLTPVGDHSCFVVKIPLRSNQKLTALHWFHNDELADFPQLVLMDAAKPQDVANQQPVASWSSVGGVSGAWTQVTLEEPLGSSTGQLLAVFELPPNKEKLGEGKNGGPALGYWEQKGGLSAWFGEMGGEWYSLAPDLKVAVEADVVTTMASATISETTSMKADLDDSPATDAAPKVYETGLLAPYPNPSNPSTEIRFSLHSASTVKLSIYNQRGERVWDLTPQVFGPGPHVVKWTGQDRGGAKVASGVYFIKLRADGKDLKQRLTVVR